MSKKITVSDEVALAIAASKKSADEILKEVLVIPVSKDMVTREGVVFPEGTAFFAWHKDRAFYGNVIDGAIDVMGEKFKTVSAAAVKVTGVSTNGWTFWTCRRPTDTDFIKISKLRTKSRRARVSK